MEIAYTAHTETCTLLLDAGGVCRSVLAASSRAAGGGGGATRIPSSAERCVGAQYVATLDLREPGGMTAMPQPGAQMLFARTEPNGRISLIRSAPVVRFDAIPARAESGIHARPEGRSSVSDDEELTIPGDSPTIPRGRRSSLPPPLGDLPQRDSAVVPAGAARRASIAPPSIPPPDPYVVEPPSDIDAPSDTETTTRPVYTIPTPPPPAPSNRASRPSRSRPSIVRINPSQPTVTELEIATRPYMRASRSR